MKRLTRKIRTRYNADKQRARGFRKHPAALAVGLFVTLFVIGFFAIYFGLQHDSQVLTVDPEENRIVHVRVDGEDRVVPTDAKTVGELLSKLDIKLAEGDRVEPAASAAIAVDNFLINVYRSAPVTVIDGKRVIQTANAGGTLRSMVTQAGVELYTADTLSSAPSETLINGSLGYRITVDRATPISVSLYSADPITFRTQATTVGEWVKQSKLQLTDKDTVKPGLETKLSTGMKIAIVRDGVQTVTVNETIAAPVRVIIDTSLSFGSQAVRQEGSDGTKVRTYKVVIEDGREVSRTLIQSVVTVQPVERIIVKGNTVNIPSDKKAVMAAAGISESDYPYVDYIFSRESRWNTAAVNATGKYVGLGQTNEGALSASCPKWQTDAVCQTKFFTGYATRRYDTWAGAYNAWLRQGWW